MPTFVDGIGASENIDSSGERIIIAGLDISSLDKDGIFNYEHKSDQPSQIVGKILKAKRIFSEKDCEDDRQKYYWTKVQVPYLYVMGELFDDFKDSAKDVAGMFRYDAAKRGQNERNVMNFSVEGAKISKEGMDIVRSIARKITITVLPCNKMAIAEMVPSSTKQPKDDIDSIFKTESVVEVELLKSDDPLVKLEMYKREDHAKHAKRLGIRPMGKDMGGGLSYGSDSGLGGSAPTSSGGISGVGLERSENIKSGKTKSGKEFFSNKPAHEHSDFSSQDHSDAEDQYRKWHSTVDMKHPKAKALQSGYSQKAKLHGRLAQKTHQKASGVASSAAKAKEQAKGPMTLKGPRTVYDPSRSGKVNYKKSEEMVKGRNNIQESPYPQAKFKGNLDVSRQKGVNKPVHGGPIGESASNPQAIKDVGGNAKAIHRGTLKDMKAMPKPSLPKSEAMGKGLDAGSMNAAPSALSGGAALGRESMATKMNTTTMPKQPTIKPQNIARPDKGFGSIKTSFGKSEKSRWLKRAEEEYEKWGKREEFRNFMQKRMPHMKMHEIDALGKTLALSKAVRAEKSLAKIGAQNYQNSYVAKKEKK
jgi:hypothetical protein